MRPDRLRYALSASCAGSGDALSPSRAGCWLSKVNGRAKKGDMRVVTAFKRMLLLDGWASVSDVSFDHKGVIVTLRRRRRRRRV
jgi:hypothetical protein